MWQWKTVCPAVLPSFAPTLKPPTLTSTPLDGTLLLFEEPVAGVELRAAQLEVA